MIDDVINESPRTTSKSERNISYELKQLSYDIKVRKISQWCPKWRPSYEIKSLRYQFFSIVRLTSHLIIISIILSIIILLCTCRITLIRSISRYNVSITRHITCITCHNTCHFYPTIISHPICHLSLTFSHIRSSGLIPSFISFI